MNQQELHELDPTDGMRVRRFDRGNWLTLELTVSVDGDLQDLGEGSSVLLEVRNPTLADLGKVNRLQLVAEAIARYFNTGGSESDLVQMLFNIKAVGSRLGSPAEYVLVSSDVVTEELPGDEAFPGTRNVSVFFEHYFVKEGTQEGALWAEDRFWQPMSLEEFHRRIGFSRAFNVSVVESYDRSAEIIVACLEHHVLLEKEAGN